MSGTLNLLIGLAMGLNLLALGSSRLPSLIRAMSLQGVVLGVMPLLLEHDALNWQVVAVALATIAGKGVANPLAQILSFAMLLRYSFAMEEDARLIERACVNVLSNGLRTPDIMAPGCAKVGTQVMGEAVVRELDKLAA